MSTAVASGAQIDPVRYEMFLHRLWAIGEEGRLALQQVTASPIVSQGGEVMSSFYNAEGTMVLACSGHLRFAAATSDAIRSLIEWFGKSPGFYDGDQIFFNDPYVAGAHTYDMMIIKPMFHDGKLIAWTATSTHTADTGGTLRGSASEIFHEGIRIRGLKIVEKGEFREDVFQSLTFQCRDPQYVGLDLKAMIAGNNVCAKRYLEVVGKFGLDFVLAAGEKVIRDSEEMARAKLRSLPDGVWTARNYVTSLDRRQRTAAVLQVICTLTKTGDSMTLDFAGTSPQMDHDSNCTLPGALAHVGVALTNTLFWDVPWSDGKFAPVTVTVPEGTVLNCNFPAACANAPWVGQVLVASICENVVKMLFAGGRLEDVNASWYALWADGGPGFLYGGHNREGIRTAQGIYDIHAGGLGATPGRDGVNSGGHMNIPAGGISDVERIEMQYPLLYFSRNHNTDGSGFGKFRGGLGSQRIYAVYGSQDFSVNYKPIGGIPHGGFGLFGGYPAGGGGLRTIFLTEANLEDRLSSGSYPARVEEITAADWGKLHHPEGSPERIALPEFTIITDFVSGGGGFGDPLLRDPEAVGCDVSIGATSPEMARRIYGVVVDSSSLAVDEAKTASLRNELREARRREGAFPDGAAAQRNPNGADATAWKQRLRIHEYLEIATNGSDDVIRCTVCEYVICAADENYKKSSLRRLVDLNDLARYALPSGEPYLGVLHEYLCPSCVTLLQVDVYCPSLGGEEDIWDLRLSLSGAN